MTNSALQLVSAFFTQTWRLLTSIYIPGTNITPAAVIVASVVIRVFFLVSKKITAGGFAGSDSNEDSK